MTKAGPIPITFARKGEGDIRASAEIPHDVHVHEAELSYDEAVKLQAELAGAARTHAPWPVVSIVDGMTFVLIRLDSMKELDALKPSSGHTARDFVTLDEGWDPTLVSLYFYVMYPLSENEIQHISCRMIHGLLEDPATGSAASTLSSYLALQRLGSNTESRTTTIAIQQGVKMGRPSEIGVEVKTEQGKVRSVSLSGNAVRVASGSIII